MVQGIAARAGAVKGGPSSGEIVEACRKALSDAADKGMPLGPVLDTYVKQRPADVSVTQFACDVMKLFYGVSVSSQLLSSLALTPQARSGAWSDIATQVHAYVRATPEVDVFAGVVDPLRDRAAVSLKPAPAPPNKQVDRPIADISHILPWEELVGPTDFSVILSYFNHRQAVFVSDTASVAGLKWLFFAMTGVSVKLQELTDHPDVAMERPLRALRLPKDGSAQIVMAPKPGARGDAKALLDALDSYAYGICPTTLLSQSVKLVGATAAVPDMLEAISVAWCDRDDPCVDTLSPCLLGMDAAANRLDAYKTLKGMHPELQWLAPVVAGMYLGNPAWTDAQRLDLIGLVAKAGVVQADEKIADAEKRLHTLQSTLASIATGGEEFGGQYVINRFVTPETARHIDLAVDRLLLSPVAAGEARERLPVGLVLGRKHRTVSKMVEVVNALEGMYPNILDTHRHGAAPKAISRDVFDGATSVSGSRLVFGGLMDLTDQDISDYLRELRTPQTRKRLLQLKNPLMAAFALSQPKHLLRNLDICEAPNQPHYLRSDLPPREPEMDRRGRRRADDVNKHMVLKWTRAGVETILNNSANTRRMASDWDELKVYAASSVCDSVTREKLQLMIDAPHVAGRVANASEQLWTRADESPLKYTEVLGALWASAKRHERRDAVLKNLATKVDLGPHPHVWCHNGLSEEACCALAGYEDKLSALTYEPPLPLANAIGQRYNGFELDALNGAELMAVRMQIWTDAERRYEGPSHDKQRDDFEDYVDAYEQFLDTIIKFCS